MADSFDPYYKWLGIPPRDQPPNHYRLLGIELLEADRDVIDAAANRLMTYLHELATGDDGQYAQTLLNEIAAARLCLLNPQKKAEYDKTVCGQVKSAIPVASPLPVPTPPAPPPRPASTTPESLLPTPIEPVSVSASTTPTTALSPPASTQSEPASVIRQRRKSGSVLPWILGGFITISLVAILFAFANSSSAPGTAPANSSPGESEKQPAVLVITLPQKARNGASIEIDGTSMNIPSSGPVRFEIEPGVHHVRITRLGFEPFDDKVGIGEGSEFTLKHNWKKSSL